MPPLSAEQLAFRQSGIGSSEIGMVVGESPWGNCHDVYLVKRGLVEPFAGNDATWLGTEMEPIIAKRYTLETGIALRDGPGTVAHPAHPWALSTTDREAADGSRIVELKWVGGRTMWHWTLEADGAPTYVQLQAQWQMACREAERNDVAVIFGATAEFRVYEFTRDDEMCSALLKIGGDFWHNHVLPGVPPPIDGSDSAKRVLLSLYPRNRRPLAPAPAGVWEWVERKVEADARGKAAEADSDLAANKLREMIGDGEGFIGDGWRVTWRADKNGKRALKVFTAKERTAA